MTRVVELRSDTFTRPTEAMRRAMYEAEVGDDVWNEDPTVHRLEEMAAECTGKEAAVFVTSGTQGNLTAILSHTRSGQEIILGNRSHIFVNEAGGAAALGGVQTRPVTNGPGGRINPDDIRNAIRGTDIHHPPTGLLALENSHNAGGGGVMSPEETALLAGIAHQAGVPVHLDGARLFNAAVAQGVPAAALTAPVDSVTFCLSKGLGSPVGSILCGTSEYIEQARRWRKMLGGGTRQVGILAAAGIVSLTEMVDRLVEDHANARQLAEGLAAIKGIDIDPDSVVTNILFFDVAPDFASTFVERLAERGVRVSGGGGHLRAVTSYE